jgi:hypothetical protein
MGVGADALDFSELIWDSLVKHKKQIRAFSFAIFL